MKRTSLSACLSVLLASGCALEGGDEGGVVIDNAPASRVKKRAERVHLEEIGYSKFTRALLKGPIAAPEPPLVLVGEIEALAIDGEVLQANRVVLHGDLAFISYNVQGEAYLGAVEVFKIGPKKNKVTTPEGIEVTVPAIELVARALYPSADVHSIAVHDSGELYAVGAEASGSMLRTLDFDDAGGLSAAGAGSLTLSSYASTDTATSGQDLYVTTGDAGGVYQLDQTTLNEIDFVALDHARGVYSAGDQVVVAQGMPGRLTVLERSATGLHVERQIAVAGMDIPASKSTVEIVEGGKAMVAAGPAGLQILDLKSGERVAEVGVPASVSVDPSDIVTNAVTREGSRIFISNGGAGVYYAKATAGLETIEVLGHLRFETRESTNHVVLKKDLLFVAAGRGGVKIVSLAPGNY